MFKNTTRRSWSLAAVVSLGMSALTGLPAQASTDVLVAPAGGTSYATLVDQTFIIQAGVGAGVPTSNLASLKWKVDKAAGFTVSATASNSVTAADLITRSDIAAATTSHVIPPVATGTVNGLALNITGANAATASRTVTVTAWLDTLPNNIVDAGESSTTVTISFVKYSEVSPTVTLTQPIQDDTRATASATVTGINLSQLAGAFGIQFAFGGTNSGSPVAYTPGAAAVGIATAALARNATVSAQLVFTPTNGSAAGLGTATVLAVTNATIQDVTASGVVSANALANGTFRMNTPFAVRAQTATSSSAVAVAGVPVTFVFTSGALSATKSISINGGAFTSSAVTVTATSGENGFAVVDVQTRGFELNDTITLTVRAQNQSGTLTLTAAQPVWVPTAQGGNFRFAAPDATLGIAYDVADQFGVASPRTNQTVEVTYTNGSSVGTYSAPVTAGVANVSIPVGTTSGTATAVARLLTLDADTLLSLVGADQTAVTISVTASPVVFDGTAPRVFPATKSAAVSGTATYSGSVSIPGATVTVTGQGLVFTNAAGATFSDSISILTGDAGNFDFTVSGTVSGVYEVRATVDASVMTSSFTVNAAAHNTGANVTITGADTSLPGRSVIYTVLVTDRFGNPVATGGTASMTVTFTGPGLFAGTLPTQTDEDGELTVTLQTASNDEGTIALSVTYNKTGASTAAADKITTVKLTSVVTPAVVLADSVELAGSASVIDGSVTSYTATVVDADGEPLAGRTVTFTAAGVLGGLTVTSVVTDADGLATTRFVSSAGSRGTLVVTAVVDGKSDDLVVAVIEDPEVVAARAAAEAAAKAAAEAAAAEAAAKAAAEAAAKAAAEAAAAEAAAAEAAAAKVGTVAVSAASTTVLTGSLTDVTITLTEVSGKAAAGRTVLLTSVGAAYLSAQTVTTDAQGKAVVKLVAGSAAGNTVITAVSEGVSANATVVVNTPEVPEVSAVIGTFNGRWAVRVENARGSVVSVKVGSRWFQFTALNDNYMFSRASRTGAELPIAVYVNGQLENVATITIR